MQELRRKSQSPGWTRARAAAFAMTAAVALIVQSSMAANAGTGPLGREVAGTTTSLVTTSNKGPAPSSVGSPATTHQSSGAASSASPRPLAPSPKVDVKWYALDPSAYNHGTGAGGTTADGLKPELEAQDFSCDDKVVFYALIDGTSLVGVNDTTVNLSFAGETTSNDPFGFSSGVSYALATGDPNYSGNGNETLGPASPSGFGTSGNDVTLSFTVGNIEGNEDIYVRIVVVLGNCGPGTSNGNVQTEVDSASTVDANGSAVNTSSGNQTVPMKFSGQRVTGTIEVIKDLNPSSDPGQFDLRIGGTTYASGGDGTDTGAQTFLQGSYTVDEQGSGGTNLADYSSSTSCQNGAAPPVVTSGTSANVALAPGDTWVCTVTNDRNPPAAPQLTIIKNVTNDDGGTSAPSDFTMNVTATNPSQSSFPGSSAGVTITLDPGSYSVSETGPSGYTATLSADCSGTIAAGEHKTCTITNDDIAPMLVVIKHVVNDSGPGSSAPSDFTMHVTATNPSQSSFPGADAPGTAVTLEAGSYSVSETGPSGYTASLSADCSGTIGIGERKTCSITNDDNAAPPPAPQLTVVKDVVNNSGTGSSAPSDFTMNVTATNPSQSSFPGSSAGVTITLDPGGYSVSETGPSGYTASLSADCSGTIAAGEHKTCTITNDDIAAPPPPPPPGGVVLAKGGPASAHVGDTITYTFGVTLAAGSRPVSSVVVTDPMCDTGPSLVSKTGGDQDSILEQGETWNYTCPHAVTALDPDPLVNTAKVTGTDANGNVVSDTDTHEVDIIHPAIRIVKTADPTTGSPGDTITYTYDVTNSGDVQLVNVSVDDNILGHVCDIPVLLPHQTQRCTGTYTIPKNANTSVENIAIAGGTDTAGERVTDQDKAIVDLVLGQTVTPTPMKTPPGGLAFTGSSAVIPLGMIAFVCLLLGSALLWLSRTRGRRSTTSEEA